MPDAMIEYTVTEQIDTGMGDDFTARAMNMLSEQAIR
jgi:hypothetical protein